MWLFSPLRWEMIQFESIWLYYSSNGLKHGWTHKLVMILQISSNPHFFALTRKPSFAEPIRSNVSVQVAARWDRQSIPNWFGTPNTIRNGHFRADWKGLKCGSLKGSCVYGCVPINPITFVKPLIPKQIYVQTCTETAFWLRALGTNNTKHAK